MLLVVAGVWVLCQTFGGKALQRLGIVSGGAPSSSTSSAGGSSSSTPPGGVIGHGSV